MPNINIYPEDRPPTPQQLVWRRFRANTIAISSLWAAGMLLLLSLFGHWLAPHQPDAQMGVLLQSPSWYEEGHVALFFGTDDLGRDILSRLIHGASLTFGSSLLVASVALIIGVSIGVLAGLSRGVLSSILHHLLDTTLAVPSLLIAVIVVSILGPGLDNALLAIILAQIPQFIRATYAAVANEWRKEYIMASRLDGSTNLRLLRFAILPNILDILVVQYTRGISSAILDISALGFLGLGAQSPAPEWGAMLADNMKLFFLAPWTVTLPGMAIMLSVLSVNIVGEGLRNALTGGWTDATT